ncbi:MAG: hypothetical protein ACYCVB_07125 [Bacilli bacterium]
MSEANAIRDTFVRGEEIIRLVPNFVPRRFGQPGRRLRLHPDDYYPLGVHRGAIKERWFSSVIAAANGPDASWDEGLSYVEVLESGGKSKVLFRNFVDELGPMLIGQSLYERYGGWPMYAKFFDFSTPLFHHLHLTDAAASLVNKLGKPEAYYFPYQLNNHLGRFPVTYFGFDPDVTIDEVRSRLLAYESGDNRITELSRASRIQLGTGWYTPPGVVHAPGSVLTYEPQWNSDVNSVYENIVAGEIYAHEFLSENCPSDKQRDIDYILSLMDWEKNVDPHYRKNYFRPPIRCKDSEEGYSESWITYGNAYFFAKELTVMPGQTVRVADPAAYGCIIIQGYGRFGVYNAESATMLRFGQYSADEYFVSESAARKGTVIENHSQTEPMVILKHFGPNRSDAPSTYQSMG